MLQSLLIKSKTASQGLACKKIFYCFPQKVVIKQNLLFIDHLILQCINFIRYLGKDVGACKQELLGESIVPVSSPVNVRTPESLFWLHLRAGNYIHKCKQPLPGLVDLEAGVRSHLLPVDFCSPWAIRCPNTANAAKEGISYTPISTKHEHTGVCGR